MMLRGTVAVFREKGDCVLKKTKPYRGKSFYKLLAAFFAVTLLCSMLMLTQYLANEKHSAKKPSNLTIPWWKKA